jgi:hypothetical protein
MLRELGTVVGENYGVRPTTTLQIRNSRSGTLNQQTLNHLRFQLLDFPVRGR